MTNNETTTILTAIKDARLCAGLPSVCDVKLHNFLTVAWAQGWQTDYRELDDRFDVWGWDASTPDNDEAWRVGIRRPADIALTVTALQDRWGTDATDWVWQGEELKSDETIIFRRQEYGLYYPHRCKDGELYRCSAEGWKQAALQDQP